MSAKAERRFNDPEAPECSIFRTKLFPAPLLTRHSMRTSWREEPGPLTPFSAQARRRLPVFLTGAHSKAMVGARPWRLGRLASSGWSDGILSVPLRLSFGRKACRLPEGSRRRRKWPRRPPRRRWTSRLPEPCQARRQRTLGLRARSQLQQGPKSALRLSMFRARSSPSGENTLSSPPRRTAGSIASDSRSRRCSLGIQPPKPLAPQRRPLENRRKPDAATPSTRPGIPPLPALLARSSRRGRSPTTWRRKSHRDDEPTSLELRQGRIVRVEQSS